MSSGSAVVTTGCPGATRGSGVTAAAGFFLGFTGLEFVFALGFTGLASFFLAPVFPTRPAGRFVVMLPAELTLPAGRFIDWGKAEAGEQIMRGEAKATKCHKTARFHDIADIFSQSSKTAGPLATYDMVFPPCRHPDHQGWLAFGLGKHRTGRTREVSETCFLAVRWGWG